MSRPIDLGTGVQLQQAIFTFCLRIVWDMTSSPFAPVKKQRSLLIVLHWLNRFLAEEKGAQVILPPKPGKGFRLQQRRGDIAVYIVGSNINTITVQLRHFK